MYSGKICYNSIMGGHFNFVNPYYKYYKTCNLQLATCKLQVASYNKTYYIYHKSGKEAESGRGFLPVNQTYNGRRHARFYTLLRELSIETGSGTTDNPYSFSNYTRIDVETYSMLFDIIEPQITASSHYRKAYYGKREICCYPAIFGNRYVALLHFQYRKCNLISFLVPFTTSLLCVFVSLSTNILFRAIIQSFAKFRDSSYDVTPPSGNWAGKTLLCDWLQLASS